MKMLGWILLVVLVLCTSGYLLGSAATVATDGPQEMHIRQFGAIPVMHEGRVKPLDTVARVLLTIISGQQSYKDASNQEQPAIRWLLEVMATNPRRIAAQRKGQSEQDDPAFKLKVFRITNDQLLGQLGLKERSGSYRYSIEEIKNGESGEKKGLSEADPNSNLRKLFDRARVGQAKRRAKEPLSEFDTKATELVQHLELYAALAGLDKPHVVPPAVNGRPWQTLSEAVQAAAQAQEEGAAPPANLQDAQRFAALLGRFAGGDAKTFNTAVEDYQYSLKGPIASDLRTARFEVFFNQYAPFLKCTVLYVAVFLLAMLGWLVFPLGWSRAVWLPAFGLLCVTLVLHTFAIGARIYIQGRPPVTNLYSSAIFIGWGVVVIALVVELLSRIGVGTAVAGVIGFVTLIIAHFLAMDGDTMEVMRAVLDTNFWLATHVTCVTLGYAATFLAGTLGVMYILLGVFTPMMKWKMGDVLGEEGLGSMSRMDLGKILSLMIYGVVCTATLLSFVGTVLGGIWADQSWGRFWGWDPKENGALLIVIWNSLVLHARWGGILRQRGVATAVVFGNIVTCWSWFGVNMLGIGLHSYGFIPAAVFWLVVVGVVHLIVIGIGMIPTRFWWSNMAEPSRPAPRVERAPHAVDAIPVG